MKHLWWFCFIFCLVTSCQEETPKALSGGKGLDNVDFWAYQIDDLDSKASIDALCNSHYDLLVIDQQRSIKGDEDYDTKADIKRIKNSENSKGDQKIVVSYIDVGQAESYRYYWQEGWKSGDPEWILDPDPDGWDDSYGVKFWSSEWKGIMKDYLGRIIDDGFDGIYLDWLMIYDFDPVVKAGEKEGVDVTDELISYVKELSAFARNKKEDFIFIAQNAPELGKYPQYVELFDAIAQEDIWYDGSGDPDGGGEEGDDPVDPDDTKNYIDALGLWSDQGKPIFNVEYAQETNNVERAYSLGAENGFKTYVTLRLLNKLTATPPPKY